MKKNCFRFLLVALVALTAVPMYGQKFIPIVKKPNPHLRGIQLLSHAKDSYHRVNPTPPVPNPGPKPPSITPVPINVPTIPKIKKAVFKPSPRLSAANAKRWKISAIVSNSTAKAFNSLRKAI